jgi:hypothetical protein
MFAANWTGHPAGKPAIVAEPNPAGGSVVYASWNGDTELDSWTVFAGSGPRCTPATSMIPCVRWRGR